MLDVECSIPTAADGEPSCNAVAGLCGEQHDNMPCLNCAGRRVGLCAGLDHDSLHRFLGVSSHLSMPPGRELVRQGEPSRYMQIVTSGGLTLSRVSRDGRRFVTGFALPGDLVGFDAEENSSVSAVALGPTEVCRLPRAIVLAMAQSSPRLAESLFAQMQNQLSAARDHMAALAYGTAQERVAQFLARLQVRQGRHGKISPRVELPMRRFDIAAHLGLTVETISRTFQALVRKQIIMNIPDGVRILSRDRLLEMASGTIECVGSRTDCPTQAPAKRAYEAFTAQSEKWRPSAS